ncbi:MAG: stage II sporulation protein M, partial [Nitrosarchaeum sp.]|nr:stage II sporulation protein M [Nitrosarchaeum sp.]
KWEIFKMFEMIINPKKVERHPWEMFFVGLVYAGLSVLIVQWVFSGDAVLSKYSGVLLVTFCVMFSFPFVYYLFKLEEEKDEKFDSIPKILGGHSTAIQSFMWLFLGFVVAFAILNTLMPGTIMFKAQIQTYCVINSPMNMDDCVARYALDKTTSSVATGNAMKELRLLSIMENNIYVLMFTLVFSLIFGAGAIFILAWNASVIAAAIGIFTQYDWKDLPFGIARYMIHGFPEIAAYFIAALAGGILGVEIIKYGVKSNRFLRVMGNTIILLFFSIIVLVVAALVEVYITPLIFS